MTLSIFADILKWSEQRPPWQRDALRHLFTSGDLTATDFDELTETCKARHGLASPNPDRASSSRHSSCENSLAIKCPRKPGALYIHAHPITDDSGAQILNYQASLAKQISDMKWEVASLQEFIHEVDAAACQIGEMFEKLPSD